MDIENLENELKNENKRYYLEVDRIRRLRDIIDTKNQQVNTKISAKQEKLNNLIVNLYQTFIKINYKI